MANVEHNETTRKKNVQDEEPRRDVQGAVLQGPVLDEFLDLARLQAELLWDFDGEWSKLDRAVTAPVTPAPATPAPDQQLSDLAESPRPSPLDHQ
jgi:hypothetical protein